MTTNFCFGLKLESDPAKEIVGEEHFVDVIYKGVVSSGDVMVGGNFAVEPTGTAAMWVSGLYAKVTQGATKAVNGYISAAEFEVINAAAGISQWCVLSLNANNDGAGHGQDEAFIMCHDYGTTKMNRLLHLAGSGIAIGAKDSGLMVVARHADAAATHAIAIKIEDTELWLMATNDSPED